jgi:hypothetical protein
LGDSAGTGLGEASTGSGFGVTLAGEVGAGSGQGELWFPHELRGSEDFSTVFSVSGVGGLSAFGDSLLGWKSCAGVSRLMALGVLHKKQKSRVD